MIDKKDVTEFFDRLAPTWDETLVRSDEKINRILDNVGVKEGSKVLDVACGTGVLIPDYLKRKVSSITAIDISKEMIDVASKKFASDDVKFIVGDVMNTDVGNGFDAIVIYNAFPHFPEPEKLIETLSKKLAPGGRLTVAHGASREEIDSHHSGFASKVSVGLMEATTLSEIFSRYLDVKDVISTKEMYQVVGQYNKEGTPSCQR